MALRKCPRRRHGVDASWRKHVRRQCTACSVRCCSPIMPASRWLTLLRGARTYRAKPSHRRQWIALGIVHTHPICIGQCVQAMCQTRFIALRTALTEFQRCGHGSAGRGAPVVDAAAAVAADVASSAMQRGCDCEVPRITRSCVRSASVNSIGTLPPSAGSASLQ